MRPNRRLWKLITVAVLTTTLSLCVCATLGIAFFQPDLPNRIWAGSSYEFRKWDCIP